MLKHGSLAVAVVQRQVMVVQAARPHGQREPWVDVYTYTPFGERVFFASSVPQARISSRDVLTIFSTDDAATRDSSSGFLELPPKAFSEYLELSSRTHQKNEQLFEALSAKIRRRWFL